MEEDIEKNYFDEDTINSLIKSEKDIEEGKTRNARDVIREFQEKYKC